jgi:hypothetical protein
VAPFEPTPLRRGLAAGAAVFPGLVLHGAGHFAAGERGTAWRLLGWEAVGLAAIVGGIGGLAVTGSSPRTTPLFIPMAVAGVGLFGTTAASDLYGVLAPSGGLGVPRAIEPWIEAEAGARYIRNPVFSYRSFLVAAVDVRSGALRVSPSAWVGAVHDNARLRLAGAYRLVGPRPTRAPAADNNGSYIDAETALTHHRYGTERFAITTGEISLGARLDLGRTAPSLLGSFVEGGVGYAAGAITYVGITSEETSLLLARFGWGCYVGRRPDRRGEVLLYYDHRHDDFAAGLKTRGLGSGPAGHFGLRARGYLSARWGAVIDGQIGSAYVIGASILVRGGGAG